ncbi:hypothetical protein Tco_0725249 [Tanacetum coccineum]|uniref:Uncharacterized protein n=2 Tax=Tanacetum coccineum TaxID=301880 RepID=A0ABQ4YDT1_9ASTR
MMRCLKASFNPPGIDDFLMLNLICEESVPKSDISIDSSPKIDSLSISSPLVDWRGLELGNNQNVTINFLVMTSVDHGRGYGRFSIWNEGWATRETIISSQLHILPLQLTSFCLLLYTPGSARSYSNPSPFPSNLQWRGLFSKNLKRDSKAGICGVDNRRITLIVIRARANSAVVVSLMEFVLVVLMEMEIKSIFQLRTLLINLQFIYPEPDYSLDFNSPQDLHNLQQQNLCCENCRGPHATIECQPMSQNSHSFGFDQLQTPQFSVNHQPPQPMSMEALQAQEDLMKSIESFLKKFNRISFGKTPKVLLQAWDNFFEVKHAQSEEVQELLSKLVQDVKIISDELSEYINTPAWNRPLVYCDDDDDEDYTIAITPESPTKEPVNSLSLGDEHLDTIPATESDEFIKSSVEILVPIPSESKGVPKVCDVPFHDNSPPLDISKDQSEDFSDSNVDSTSTDEDSFSSNDVEYVEASPPNSEPVSSKVMEIVIPEVGRIEDDILLIKDDTLREKLLNVNRLVAKIKALKDNPVPSSVVVTKSTSTFPNLFLEETNTFDNSLPESETFCFNLEEPSSGSPTTPSDLSLPDYKAFYIDNDHFKEKSSGSTTTHVDFSQYDSFIFDLSNDQFPPTDRSDFYHEEFADELAQIISQPEYDCFFKDEPELGNFTMDVVGNIFQTKEPRVHVLNVLPTLELDFIPSSESIFAYVVWIFLPFLFIPVIPPYLLSCGDEDTIFDPGISKDCPDCEDSQFCHSSRVSHPQLHLGIRYPNLID